RQRSIHSDGLPQRRQRSDGAGTETAAQKNRQPLEDRPGGDSEDLGHVTRLSSAKTWFLVCNEKPLTPPAANSENSRADAQGALDKKPAVADALEAGGRKGGARTVRSNPRSPWGSFNPA